MDRGPKGELTPSSAELLDSAVAAARAGGAVLVDGMARAGPIEDVQLKSERSSIVTAVDLEAQREVVRVITERFPTHAVLGEEGDVEGRDVTWLVDPLDGTSNYAHGIPFACTSVAVRDGAGVVAGAVFDPFRDELFTAVRGGGAWLGDRRLAVSTTGALAQAMVTTGVQSDDDDAVTRFGRRIVALTRHCRAVRCLGSPALCLAYVAAGRIDGFVERDSTYAWDVGAGSLLIAEAGGTVEDLDGGPINLGPGVADVLASNGHLHAALASLLASLNS